MNTKIYWIRTPWKTDGSIRVATENLKILREGSVGVVDCLEPKYGWVDTYLCTKCYIPILPPVKCKQLCIKCHERRFF